MKITGIDLIAEERKEQLVKHKVTVDYDVEHNKKGELSFAAALLCCPNPEKYQVEGAGKPEGWDIIIWNHMIKKSYGERLIIAGSLIAAEIDRIIKIHEK